MDKRFTLPLISSFLLVLSFSGLTRAAVPASGEFTATQSCQAYQSMRKKTNPDNTVLRVGQDYPIVEVNAGQGATWYRITIASARPADRWVYFECGAASNVVAGSRSNHHSDCSVAGREDSYVFAVSWQPAFCESKPGKPECSVKDPGSYQANNFTLHGLWANKNSCGTGYGFCGPNNKKKRNFCDYPQVPMSPATREQLGRVMPSVTYGSCLQRHEWYKHGTCQIEWDADGYYGTAMRLLSEFNGSGANSLTAFMQAHIGKTVSINELNDKIDMLFGHGAHTRMQYGCTNGNKLVDIYINLPKQLGNKPLADLIQQAPEKYSNKCGSSFVVDPIN